MKTQQLYGITFYYENFTHSIARNVLSEFLRVRFSFTHEYKNVPSDLETVMRFKQLFPTIKNIKVMQVEPRDKSLDPYCIRRLAITAMF